MTLSTVRTLLAACAAGILLPSVSAAAEGSGAPVCLFGRERFTIEYRLHGSESGTLTQHVRECGRLRAELQTGDAGEPPRRRLYRDAQVVTVDPRSGAASRSRDATHDRVAEALRDVAPDGRGAALMAALGALPSGEHGEFAGVACDYWHLPDNGATLCVTAWGATLYATTGDPRDATARTATAVRIGDGGPADLFNLDERNAPGSPDIGRILRRMGHDDWH